MDAETSLLFPEEHPHICPEGAQCPQGVVEIRGRFYVTFGHAGFNSPANNANGYATVARARSTITHYDSKGA